LLRCFFQLENFWETSVKKQYRKIQKLKHSTAKPIEPGLEETLKIAASGKEDYPGAKHEFEEWRGDALLSPPGTVHCLGVSVPPGGGVVSTRIAFVRVRPAR
jgi:hypothetical protein